MQLLLQSVMVITKCDGYYKVRRLLQSASVITKCDGYYKVRQYRRGLHEGNKAAALEATLQPSWENKLLVQIHPRRVPTVQDLP